MTASPVTRIRYEWKKGFQTPIKAEVAGKELERIAQKYGAVVPKTVVEESRDIHAPLHRHFEWDNDVASDLYREKQAQDGLRNIVVIHVRNDTEEELPPTRAFVRITEAPPKHNDVAQPKHYIPIARVMSDQDLREQYVRQAFTSLVAWRTRHQDIKEFARIFDEIDMLRKQYEM